MEHQEHTNSAERLVKNERSNSLAALLRAIKFCTSRGDNSKSSGHSAAIKQHFAQPRQRARQRSMLPEENFWIRSAN